MPIIAALSFEILSLYFLSVFEGVPTFEVNRNEIEAGVNIVELLTDKARIMSSKGEARRSLKENAISINKEKVNEDFVSSADCLLNNQYILVQKGKKTYFIIRAV